mgnify:FL=1
MGNIIMDSFDVEMREQELEDKVDEAETELEGLRDQLGRIEGYSARLLHSLGVSGKKADFVYSVLDLEETGTRVDSVSLTNLDVLTAEVKLNRRFRDIDSLRNYLEKHKLDGGVLSREGEGYKLYRPELGVAVYFSMKKDQQK